MQNNEKNSSRSDVNRRVQAQAGRALDWHEYLSRMAQMATSVLAQDKIANLPFLDSVKDICDQLVKIQKWSGLLKAGLRPRMESLDVTDPWMQRLQRRAVLKTLELRDVRFFCIESHALKEVLDELEFGHEMFDASEPLSAIDQIMTPDGDIREDASEKLYSLNVEKRNLSKSIQQTMEKLVRAHNLEPFLQDRFVTTREGRWVIPIKSGMQHGFQGLVHGASQSKQTVFMEPQEIVPANNRLREVEVELENEIERLLADISEYLAARYQEFTLAKKILLDADITLAMGQMMVQLGATTQFEITDNELDLKDVRHPLLVLNGVDVIPNSLALAGDSRILLLSGPNAGGKTVLLKSVGLAAMMARAGLPICASNGSKVPFIREFVVSVGDSQSVDANLSTFAAHLKILDRATTIKGSQGLVLIDEICGSTDPEEGTALARSFIEAYRENKVFAIVTSHLNALKTGWSKTPGVVNGSLDFDHERGPTHRFLLGVAGQSLAIQTAKRAGVATAIVERALGFLSPESRQYQEGMTEIEKMKKEVLSLQDMLAAELKKAHREKSKYEELNKKLISERDQILNQEVKKASRKVETLIKETKVEAVFRRHEALQKIKYELPEIIKAQPTQSAGSANAKKISTREDFAKYYPAGTKIFIPSLAREGVVQGLPMGKMKFPFYPILFD